MKGVFFGHKQSSFIVPGPDGARRRTEAGSVVSAPVTVGPQAATRMLSARMRHHPLTARWVRPRLPIPRTADGYMTRPRRSPSGHPRPPHPQRRSRGGPAHGYAVARWLEQLTGEVLRIGEGVALSRPSTGSRERGWLSSTWQLSSTNRPHERFIGLTAQGAGSSFAPEAGRVDAIRCGRFIKCSRTEEQPA